MLIFSTAFFISFTVFFSPRIWFDFNDFYSLLNFSFYLCIVFLLLLTSLSVFSCSSLSFLKTAILNSLPVKLQTSFSLGLLENYCISFMVSSCFLDFSCSLMFVLLSLHLKKQSPPPCFTDGFSEINPFYQPCWGFWGFLRPFLWVHLLYTSCYLLWQNS